MTWELADATSVRGPYEDEQVIALLERGLDPGTVARRVGEDEWRSLRAHPPFAMAIERSAGRVQATSPAMPAPAAVQPPSPRSASGTIYGAIAIGFALLCGCGIIGAIRGGGDKPTVTSITPSETATPKPAAAKTHEEEPSLAAKILAIKSLPAAVSTIRPMMSDSVNESSPGATILAIWMWNNGKWSDLGVKDETTFGKIQKDSDEERGKRYCASGSLIEIAAQKFDGGKIDVGLLMDDSMRLFHFQSAGSSGSLVANSPARFCGVVTGKFDYSNSAGGTGHAVEIVGMFDLPENRKKR